MEALAEQIGDIDGVEIFGRVVAVRGLMVEVPGPIYAMSVGARLTIETGGTSIPCEVVGFSGGHALAMPFAALEGVRRGCRAVGLERGRCHSSFRALARPRRQCACRADRWTGTATGRTRTVSLPCFAAA